MGVGIIGVSSGAAEVVPFGAGALRASGFVNGLTYDYTATVPVGRYVIECSTQDGETPVVAYAPNSNTTAIAYPGKSAILSVTTQESVIRFSAMPVVGRTAIRGHDTNNGSWYHRNTGAASKPDGTILVESIVTYTGSQWYTELWTSTDSGLTWANTYSLSGYSGGYMTLRWYGDDATGFFLVSAPNNNLLKSSNGTSWSSKITNQYVYETAEVGGGVFLAASGGGIYRSTNNAESWTQVFVSISIYDIVKIEGTNTWVGLDYEDTVYSTNDGANWTYLNYAQANLQNHSFQTYYGLSALKNYAVAGNNIYPASGFVGGGVRLIDSIGRTIVSTFQATSGNLTNRINAEFPGGEWPWIVKMTQNRGFVLAIANQSGTLSLSTDGMSWVPVAIIPGWGNRQSDGKQSLASPNYSSKEMVITTNMTGSIARFTNSFGYKIFDSKI